MVSAVGSAPETVLERLQPVRAHLQVAVLPLHAESEGFSDYHAPDRGGYFISSDCALFSFVCLPRYMPRRESPQFLAIVWFFCKTLEECLASFHGGPGVSP